MGIGTRPANLISSHRKTKKVFMESINRDSLTTATTVICATKVNYWLMNHHVGQSPDRNMAVGHVHRLAVCYKSARRLSKCQYSHYCPNTSDFGVLPRWRERIMANPVIYHIGVLYLTVQKDTSFSDMIFKIFVGRLGTFRTTVASRSTLCQSPHFVASKIENAPDYDPTWRQILKQMTMMPSFSQ
jgi:hypothetical protein